MVRAPHLVAATGRSSKETELRHSDSRETLEYGEAVTKSTREAHGKVVSMVFGKQKETLGDRV
jgi:hypothetical protein